LTDPRKSNEALNLESRRKIYEVVKDHAGSHLREIQRVAGKSFGSVSYHLAYLLKHRLIREERDGNYVRYFPTNADIGDEKLLSLLRQRSVRTILLFIVTHGGCNHKEISSSVNLSPSTTTWHLKKLLESNIIISNKKDKCKVYSLNVPPGKIVGLLKEYQESFFDTLVDGLLDLWE